MTTFSPTTQPAPSDTLRPSFALGAITADGWMPDCVITGLKSCDTRAK
jgi:hypothetical protein